MTDPKAKMNDLLKGFGFACGAMALEHPNEVSVNEEAVYLTRLALIELMEGLIPEYEYNPNHLVAEEGFFDCRKQMLDNIKALR